MTNLTKTQQAEVKKEIDKQVKKELSKQLFEKTAVIGSEFKKQITTALIAAFGLVIALSWQTLIKKFIEVTPKSGSLLYHPYLADLYTAILVTLFGTLAILIISRWAKKPEIHG